MSRTLAYAQCWDQKTGGNFTVYRIHEDDDGTVEVHCGVRDTNKHHTIKIPPNVWKKAVERWRERKA